MKKTFLSFVFVLSLGMTLYICSAFGENKYPHSETHYEFCTKTYLEEISTNIVPTEKSNPKVIPCPKNAAFFYIWDKSEKKWSVSNCPEGLFFCSELQACSYIGNPNCDFDDTEVNPK